MRVTEWICEDDGYFCYRAIEGKDHDHIAFRVAAIEKTPRDRVSPFGVLSENDSWDYGPTGSSGSGVFDTCAEEQSYGSYPPSREWCDTRLKELGYEFPEEGDQNETR